MSALDAFRHAMAVVYTSVDYDWTKLRAIQASGLDLFAWGTPDETRKDGKGICREKAILACDEAWKRGARDVRMVVGTVDADGCGHCGGTGHAWCEVHDGDVIRWGDPTNTADVVEPAEWETSRLRYAPQTAYAYDGGGFAEAYDFVKETV